MISVIDEQFVES